MPTLLRWRVHRSNARDASRGPVAGCDSAVEWILVLVGASVGLVVLAVVAGELVTRRLVKPLEGAARGALKLAQGQPLERADITGGPGEVATLTQALWLLADRIDTLVTDEHAARAELSHQLRTRMTAMRLDAATIHDAALAEQMSLHLDSLEKAMSGLAKPLPSLNATPLPTCRARTVVEERVAFWSPLAEDEQRDLRVELPDDPVLVRAPAIDLASAVDALIDNIFAHTDAGVPFAVTLHRRGDRAELVIADGGAGLPTNAAAADRSDRVSGGQGLVNSRRWATRNGGEIRIGRSTLGGAEVTLSLPVVHTPA